MFITVNFHWGAAAVLQIGNLKEKDMKILRETNPSDSAGLLG